MIKIIPWLRIPLECLKSADKLTTIFLLCKGFREVTLMSIWGWNVKYYQKVTIFWSQTMDVITDILCAMFSESCKCRWKRIEYESKTIKHSIKHSMKSTFLWPPTTSQTFLKVIFHCFLALVWIKSVSKGCNTICCVNYS